MPPPADLANLIAQWWYRSHPEIAEKLKAGATNMTRAPSTIEISADELRIVAPYDPTIHGRRQWANFPNYYARELNEIFRELNIERLSLSTYSGEFPWSF